MTSEELKNKIVYLSVSGTTSFKLSDDLDESDLNEFLNIQKENNWTDRELLDEIAYRIYRNSEFEQDYAPDLLDHCLQYTIEIND